MDTLFRIQNLRKEYASASLDLSDTDADPFVQFGRWFTQAMLAQVEEPNAMTLATVDADLQPSARIVLLKDFDYQGFVFYTNYDSHKGQQLKIHPKAALCFFWHALERQVRIEGEVTKVSSDVATAYFQSRPKSSQLGALASPQSQEVPDRAWLEQKMSELSIKHEADLTVPRPNNWGGYCVNPHKIEFWQGRPSRLHDRIVYQKQADGTWKRSRLAP
jgi:pyridoxamine 5'-phosphate oxidase